ncbi:hypothetical protein FOT48_18225 [Citrobacter koseri]|nr:hypothetical protein [Citrobacter koseri]MBE0083744.1 hypothetical protein [Citrobacter koseri]
MKKASCGKPFLFPGHAVWANPGATLIPGYMNNFNTTPVVFRSTSGSPFIAGCRTYTQSAFSCDSTYR